MDNNQLNQYLASCGRNYEGYYRTKNARFCPECDSRIPDNFATGQLGKPCPQCETIIKIDENKVTAVTFERKVADDYRPKRASIIVAIDKAQDIKPHSLKVNPNDLGSNGIHCLGCRKVIEDNISSSLVKMLVEYIKWDRTWVERGMRMVKTIRVPKFIVGRACKACAPSTVQTVIIQHTPGTPLPEGYDHLAIGDMFFIASLEPVDRNTAQMKQSLFEDVSKDNDYKSDDEKVIDGRWDDNSLSGEELMSKEQMTKSFNWLGSVPDIPKRRRPFPRRPELERQYVNSEGIVVRRYKSQ